MNNQDFEKTDRSLMAALKGLREKPTDSAGIPAEVERRLRAAAAPSRYRVRRALPWLVPALALSLVLAVPALRAPSLIPGPDTARIQLASKPSAVSLAEEIAILKEVGAWTDDDDRHVAPEAEFEEVELSRADSTTEIV